MSSNTLNCSNQELTSLPTLPNSLNTMLSKTIFTKLFAYKKSKVKRRNEVFTNYLASKMSSPISYQNNNVPTLNQSNDLLQLGNYSTELTSFTDQFDKQPTEFHNDFLRSETEKTMYCVVFFVQQSNF